MCRGLQQPVINWEQLLGEPGTFKLHIRAKWEGTEPVSMRAGWNGVCTVINTDHLIVRAYH